MNRPIRAVRKHQGCCPKPECSGTGVGNRLIRVVLGAEIARALAARTGLGDELTPLAGPFSQGLGG